MDTKEKNILTIFDIYDVIEKDIDNYTKKNVGKTFQKAINQLEFMKAYLETLDNSILTKHLKIKE